MTDREKPGECNSRAAPHVPEDGKCGATWRRGCRIPGGHEWPRLSSTRGDGGLCGHGAARRVPDWRRAGWSVPRPWLGRWVGSCRRSAFGHGVGMDQLPLASRLGQRHRRAHCEGKSPERGAAIVARGVGRIFLIALVAYVIFTCSLRGLVGFLAGLTMPVIAMMCEAVYEFVASNRRSS